MKLTCQYHFIGSDLPCGALPDHKVHIYGAWPGPEEYHAFIPEDEVGRKRLVVNQLRALHDIPAAANDEVVLEDFDWYQERLMQVGYRLSENSR